MTDEEPEFNNGFVTALGLFYGHNDISMRAQVIAGKQMMDYRLDGAKDHIYDLEIPECIGDELRQQITDWRDAVFTFHHRVRLTPSTREDVEQIDGFFHRCYQLLMMIDGQVFGLNVKVNHP